jgi:hypothetical protein
MAVNSFYKIGPSLKRLARDKRSSLCVSEKEGSVIITLTPVVNVIKLFSFVTDDKA